MVHGYFAQGVGCCLEESRGDHDPAVGLVVVERLVGVQSGEDEEEEGEDGAGDWGGAEGPDGGGGGGIDTLRHSEMG